MTTSLLGSDLRSLIAAIPGSLQAAAAAPEARVAATELASTAADPVVSSPAEVVTLWAAAINSAATAALAERIRQIGTTGATSTSFNLGLTIDDGRLRVYPALTSTYTAQIPVNEIITVPGQNITVLGGTVGPINLEFVNGSCFGSDPCGEKVDINRFALPQTTLHLPDVTVQLGSPTTTVDVRVTTTVGGSALKLHPGKLFDSAFTIPQIPVNVAGSVALNIPILATVAPNNPVSSPDTLQQGQELSIGDSLTSKNGAYTLRLQPDGNLVLSSRGDPIWSTGTSNQGVDRAELQDDGNFVLYAGDSPKWNTFTAGKQDVRLVMQDDRNVVLYAADGAPWSSQTASDAPPPISPIQLDGFDITGVNGTITVHEKALVPLDFGPDPFQVGVCDNPSTCNDSIHIPSIRIDVDGPLLSGVIGGADTSIPLSATGGLGPVEVTLGGPLGPITVTGAGGEPVQAVLNGAVGVNVPITAQVGDMVLNSVTLPAGSSWTHNNVPSAFALWQTNANWPLMASFSDDVGTNMIIPVTGITIPPIVAHMPKVTALIGGPDTSIPINLDVGIGPIKATLQTEYLVPTGVVVSGADGGELPIDVKAGLGVNVPIRVDMTQIEITAASADGAPPTPTVASKNPTTALTTVLEAATHTGAPQPTRAAEVDGVRVRAVALLDKIGQLTALPNLLSAALWQIRRALSPVGADVGRWGTAPCVAAKDCSGLDLTGVNLAGQDLSGVKFIDTTLTNANLSKTMMNSTDLTGATLTAADLGDAQILAANLSGANLGGASLARATLTGVTLDKANLTGAILQQAVLDSTNTLFFPVNSLKNATLKSADLTGARMNAVNLTGADLSGAKLTGADFSFADLQGAKLANSEAKGAVFVGADMQAADLSSADFESVDLRAVLNGADLTAANLTSANLAGTSLTGANLTRAILITAVLAGLDLNDEIRGANLTDTDLSFANFTGAQSLRDAILTGAVWHDSICPDGSTTSSGCSNPTSIVIPTIQIGQGGLVGIYEPFPVTCGIACTVTQVGLNLTFGSTTVLPDSSGQTTGIVVEPISVGFLDSGGNVLTATLGGSGEGAGVTLNAGIGPVQIPLLGSVPPTPWNYTLDGGIDVPVSGELSALRTNGITTSIPFNVSTWARQAGCGFASCKWSNWGSPITLDTDNLGGYAAPAILFPSAPIDDGYKRDYHQSGSGSFGTGRPPLSSASATR